MAEVAVAAAAPQRPNTRPSPKPPDRLSMSGSVSDSQWPGAMGFSTTAPDLLSKGWAAKKQKK